MKNIYVELFNLIESVCAKSLAVLLSGVPRKADGTYNWDMQSKVTQSQSTGEMLLELVDNVCEVIDNHCADWPLYRTLVRHKYFDRDRFYYYPWALLNLYFHYTRGDGVIEYQEDISKFEAWMGDIIALGHESTAENKDVFEKMRAISKKKIEEYTAEEYNFYDSVSMAWLACGLLFYFLNWYEALKGGTEKRDISQLIPPLPKFEILQVH